MKLSNSVMFESIQTLTTVKETGKLGYACARNLRRLLDACREYMEERDRLLKEYGTDQGGGQYTFEPANARDFSCKLQEFAVIEHEVDVMQVDEEVFCSGNLTTKEMFTLSWMVKEEADVC